MQIVRLDLENVKSYRQHSVSFTRGTNAICGANGSGKSTLLEAIGFALFDALPYTQDQFVREGEKVAAVTVHLEDREGRAYQVVRKCGSYGQYYVYDPELDAKLTTDKSETIEWLHEVFGVDPSADLSTLFGDAVGVPQGLLTAAFLETPARRRDIFNPLLRVDEYETVWQSLREPRRRLQENIAGQEKAMAGYEAQVKALPARQARVGELQAAIAADETRQAEIEAQIQAAAARREAMEAVKERLDALERQVTRAEGQVGAVEGRLDDARQAVARAEAAQQAVGETEAGHQAYRDAQGELEALEVQRQARDDLAARVQARSADLRLARSRLEGLEADLADIARAESEMARLRPQVEEQGRLDEALAEARLEAERLANAQQRLAQERRRLDDLQARLGEARSGLEERRAVEAEVAPLRTAVDKLDKQYTALSTKQAARQAELDQLAGQIARARQRLAGAERDLGQRQGTLDDLARRLKEAELGLAQRQTVEDELKALRDRLHAAEEAVRDQADLVARRRAALDQNQAQIEVLEASAAAECPVCREPLTPDHRAELLDEHAARRQDLQEELDAARARQKEAETERAETRRAIDAAEDRLQALPRPSDRQDLADRVAAQEDEVAASREAIAATQEELSGSEDRHQAVQTELAALHERQEQAQAERGEKRAALAEHERRLKTLPRPEQVAALEEDLARQEALVDEAVQAVKAHTGAPDEVERLEGALAALGDPRGAYRSAADTAERRPSTEAARDRANNEIAERETQLADLEEQLQDYADLDAQLERQRARAAKHESDHQRYLEHIREAETLTERQQRAAELRQELREARDAYRSLLERRDQTAAEYDAPAHTDLVAQLDGWVSEQAALQERLRLQQEQLSETEAEVARLQQVQQALDEARAERDELQETLALLEYLRQVLRDAGPKITQALVRVISLHAARTYADIMSDHSARLQWTDEYEILLSASGRERTFKQLSGGEQMAAALAVRLALLREVSDIDVAFFDEPTANLDEARRDNLAEQIMNVKGFSQLFVISHDDTFERDTDHVVRVIKENGASRAEG